MHGDLRHKSSFRRNLCVLCARASDLHGSSFPLVVLTQETGAARSRECGRECTHITELRARVEKAKRRTHRMSKPHVPLIAPARSSLRTA
ncbi:uncharacterized [Tachysurus ichikawai]